MKYPYMVKRGGKYYPAGVEVPDIDPPDADDEKKDDAPDKPIKVKSNRRNANAATAMPAQSEELDGAAGAPNPDS